MAQSSQLPDTVSTALTAFTDAARRAFADDLVAVVLFGSAAEGRLRPTSDVNLIVVLARLDPARLAAIGEPYRLAHAVIGLEAMFILDNEIAAASESFAVKFIDIATRHEVLYGRDPFAELPIPREAAIHRLRQVLLNLVLRLRERYALSSSYADRLARAAADAVGPLRASAAVLLSLERGVELTPREALRQFAEASGTEAALAAIVAARETGAVPEAGGPATLFGAIAIATQLAARAERLAG